MIKFRVIFILTRYKGTCKGAEKFLRIYKSVQKILIIIQDTK